MNDYFRVVSYVFEQINEDISDYNYLELATGLQYQTPLPWLSFLLYYQQSYSKGDDDTWLLEQKPSINMNTTLTLSHFKFTEQIRYEYRISAAWHDYRIKNTLTVCLHDVFLQPYTGWELYYEGHDRAFMLNRNKVGITRNVYRSVWLGTYYRIDLSNADGGWGFKRQLVGLQVTLKFE